MAINIYYRINGTNPPLPQRDVVLSRPLTMLEIDANFKSISNAYQQLVDKTQDIDIILDSKANIDSPRFIGSLTLPIVTTATYPQPAKDGMIVYNRDISDLVIHKDGEWQSISTQFENTGFVKKSGDVMSGKLTGTTAEFTQGLKTLPPDSEVGEATDTVTTVRWVLNKIKELIEQRLSGGDPEYGGTIVIQDGDLIIRNGYFRGDYDCGQL